jgi:hypothetical protein
VRWSLWEADVTLYLCEGVFFAARKRRERHCMSTLLHAGLRCRHKIASARPPLVRGGPAVVSILFKSSCDSKSGPGIMFALWDGGATATECKWLLKLTGDASYEDAGSASRFAPFARVARIQNLRRIKPKGSIRYKRHTNMSQWAAPG